MVVLPLRAGRQSAIASKPIRGKRFVERAVRGEGLP